MRALKMLDRRDVDGAARWDQFVLGCPNASFFHRAVPKSSPMGVRIPACWNACAMRSSICLSLSEAPGKEAS